MGGRTSFWGTLMENICFDFSSFHRYGTAFYDFLALRKQVFVDELGWDIPHNQEVEMDQYDTPIARYSLVLKDGKVVGGARAMATNAVWGEHSYMLRDARIGKLQHIPPQVMNVEITNPRVWECTRLVISPSLATAAERSQCLAMLTDGLVDMAREAGAEELICLSSIAVMRLLRGLGYDCTRIGETYRNDEDGRIYGVLHMPAAYSNLRKARVKPIPFPQRATVRPMPAELNEQIA